MPELTLDAGVARSYAVATLLAGGYSQDDAQLCASCLHESSLRGIDSHGIVALLPVYAAAPGQSDASPRVIRERGAVAVVDGNRALGLRTARASLAAATRLAARQGVGACVARNVGYLGALWWSIHPAAVDGLVALAATNSMACVAPHAGREPLHGTNPIAVAVPCEPDPIVLDMRTNALRMADYWEAVRSGGRLPEDTLIDRDGEPLTDPGRIDEAVYLPLAGPRGYGLALVVDLLTAALAGGPIGREVIAEFEAGELSAFFLVLAPAAFGPEERFVEAVQRLARQVHETTPCDPREPVRLPGERAAAERARRLARGIPVDLGLWEEMENRLARLGIRTERPAFDTGGGR